jgi:MFS family permease
LIFVGAGWNFGFVGGTTVLVDSHSPEERGRVQGMNDLFVFGGVTMASFASGGLMNCSGGSPQTGWTTVNIGVAPLVIFGGLALFSLVKRHRMNRC